MSAGGGIAGMTARRMTARLLALLLLCQAGFVHAAGMHATHSFDAVATAAGHAHDAGHHPADRHGGESHCAERDAMPACDQHADHACPLCAGACGYALPVQARAMTPDSPALPRAAQAAAHFSAPPDSPYRPPALA
jgi:hypothetical protein